MSSTLRMWTEIVFNIGYLLVIWIMAAKMFKSADAVKPKDLPVARNMMIAFVLLALGDTGHVGFRVLAYSLGGLEKKLELFGGQLSLVGSGALATAITITLFYVILLDTWRKRFNGKYGVFTYILIIAAIIRFILFIHPGNQWGNIIPPFGWSVARNVPLMLQGIGAAYLILRDSIRYKDKAFRAIGILILISFACYMPVIFLVQKLSWIGTLMIPKTLAYLAIAFIAYKELYSSQKQVEYKSKQMNMSL